MTWYGWQIRMTKNFLNHLTDDEGVQLRKVPCARVTTTDIAEHMGISASTYEKWTGKSTGFERK